MYLITNAMKNLLRNKGRNILIAAVTLAIILSAVVTLTINNAASKVIDGIRLDLGSRVEIRQDLIQMRQIGLGREDVSFVSINDFIEYARSDYLRTTVFNADMYAWSDTLCAVGDDPSNPGGTTRTNDNGEVVFVETCKLVSTSVPESLADFGTLRYISSGRMFEGLNECIVSEDFALLNGISAGDAIELKGASYAREKSFNLTVTGIYADGTQDYANFFMEMNGRFADNRRNEIITGFDTMMSAGWETNSGLDMKTAYYLRDPDEISLFEAEVRSKGIPVTYNVSINQAAYDKVSGPLSSLRSAVMTFMVVILVLGAIVLALISFLAVRERKYEVGVLRAMGMERGKVAFGILMEAVVIAVICLAIGLAAGVAIAQPIADGILEGKVAEVEAVPTRNVALFTAGQSQIGDGSEGFTPESEIQVNLGADVFIQIIIVTLALAALTGVVGVVVITRYEPLTILRERN